MPDAEHLFLAARIRMLRRSLEAVRDSLKSVEDERKVMRDLLPNILQDTYEKLRAVDIAAENIRATVELSLVEGPIGIQLDSIREETKQIRSYLTAVRSGTRAIGVLQRETETALQDHLIAAVENQIEAATTLLDAVTDAATPAQIQAAWQQQRTLFAESQQFFAEYVELLTGLALRDSGFDRGIAEISDALIRRGIAGWYSLTIPSHKPPEALTRSGFIHLGFPEWSPWALPLAAFDVGRLESRKGDLPAFVTARVDAGFRRFDVENGLADSIATYLVGPAYAWATVIQFDPGAGFVDRRGASRRLQAILATLRTLDDPATPTDQPFGTIATELQEAWQAALDEAGDAKPSDAEVTEAGREVDEAETASWVAELKASYRPRAMRSDDWQAVTDLADALRAEEETQPPDDLRAILNAGWKVRMEDKLDRSGDDAPLQALGERVGMLLRTAAATSVQGVGAGRLKSPVAAVRQ